MLHEEWFSNTGWPWTENSVNPYTHSGNGSALPEPGKYYIYALFKICPFQYILEYFTTEKLF